MSILGVPVPNRQHCGGLWQCGCESRGRENMPPYDLDHYTLAVAALLLYKSWQLSGAVCTVAEYRKARLLLGVGYKGADVLVMSRYKLLWEVLLLNGPKELGILRREHEDDYGCRGENADNCEGVISWGGCGRVNIITGYKTGKLLRVGICHKYCTQADKQQQNTTVTKTGRDLIRFKKGLK